MGSNTEDNDESGNYFGYTIHHGVEGLLNEAERRDVEEHVQHEPARRGVRMGRAYHHVPLRV